VTRLAAAGLSLDGHCMQYGSRPVDVSDPPSISAAVGECECWVSCSALHAACSAGLFSPSASMRVMMRFAGVPIAVLSRHLCHHLVCITPSTLTCRWLSPSNRVPALVRCGSCVCAAGVAVELPRRRGRDDISWRSADAVRLAVVDAPRCDVRCERAAVRGGAEVRGDGAHRDP
jgi:hypothetical protein